MREVERINRKEEKIEGMERGNGRERKKVKRQCTEENDKREANREWNTTKGRQTRSGIWKQKNTIEMDNEDKL